MGIFTLASFSSSSVLCPFKHSFWPVNDRLNYLDVSIKMEFPCRVFCCCCFQKEKKKKWGLETLGTFNARY